MKRIALALGMGALLVAAAPVKLAPADDPVKPVGAAARAKYGPEPLAKPPADVGSAEDPVPAQAPAQPGQALAGPKPTPSALQPH